MLGLGGGAAPVYHRRTIIRPPGIARLARLSFADQIRDIDLVVFDKDGTLIDFDFTWSQRCLRSVDALIAERPARAAERDRLLRTIGIDPLTAKSLPESPVVVGSLAEVVTVCATVLHQAGEPWTTATMAAEAHVRPILGAPPRLDEVRTIGDVAGLFARLRDAGVAVGVLTNDDRAGTVATLFNLGLLPLVSAIVCADDQHGAKPDPGGLLHLAAHAGVPLGRVALVGDAIGDLVTARRAGAAIGIGVLSGAARRADLEPHADAILDDIGAIAILADPAIA